MKARILLCMMALWAICAAQPPQQLMPRVLDNGFRMMPNMNQIAVKPYETTMKNTAPSSAIKRANKVRAEQPTHQVNFVLDFDDEIGQKPHEIVLKNKDYELRNPDLGLDQLQKGFNVLSIPEGTYDIIVTFFQLDITQPYESVLYDMLVIREQVAIDQDMTQNFAADEAKNHIHFQTLTIDGEPAFTGRWSVDEFYNWTQLEVGNCDDIYCARRLFCSDYGTMYVSNGNFGTVIEGENYHSAGGELSSDFFVNDVSDRYTFYSSRLVTDGLNMYTSAYETQGANSDITITNDPSKFVKFEDPFVVNNHESQDLTPFVDFTPLRPGDWYYSMITLNSDEGKRFTFFLSADVNDSQVGYVPYIQPYVSIKKTQTMPWGEEFEYYMPVLQSKRLTLSNNQAIFMNNGIGTEFVSLFGFEYSEELNEFGDDEYIYPFWPTHPVFSTCVDKKKDVLGDNCPVMITNPYFDEVTSNWEDEDGNIVSQTEKQFHFPVNYLGRYGETKPLDNNEVQVDIKLDGEDFIHALGGFSMQLDELFTGVVDAAITNEAIVVDGMECSNKAQLRYTAGAEDQAPPTITMLHFKKSNGDVTDRITTANEGFLEFSAGDFNRWITPMGASVYDRYAPESVEVSYSPYGEDNWNELPMEEVPENYWPVMGWFYSGSLAGVTGEALNGWFDLKIRLTDAAGNWQEQVLSPAFRIDDLAYSSVATVGSSNAHEVARYNLAGQRVDTNTPGVAIVKMSDGTARKVIVP